MSTDTTPAQSRSGTQGLDPASPPVLTSPPDIEQMWPLPVWVADIDVRAAAEQMGDLPGSTTPYARAPQMPFSAAVQHAAAQACGHDAPGDWLWEQRIEQWDPGFFVGARYGAGTVQAFVVLASQPPSACPDSGAICVHDPREGTGNVGLPGLPWGRPMKLPARRGLALAIPGWARWSIAPLRPAHTMTVWIAQGRTIIHGEEGE
jgi:hypothetical protein